MKIPYGVAETIGSRPYMEDSHVIRRYEALGLFSAEVYDGHGGALAGTTAAELLTPCFVSLSSGEVRAALDKWFAPEQVRHAYLATDAGITDRGIEGGAAAATLYLRKDHFIAANVGDVRIVLGDGFKAIQVTLDHKPDLPEERERIEALGGQVVTYDQPRVQGALAMSRALGDAYLKPYVIAEPRIAEGFLGRKTDVAILASDGIWDVLSLKEAVSLARGAGDPQTGAESIQSKALERGSRDNITVIVLDLKAYTARCTRRRLHIARVIDWAVSDS